jgi:hypothetical protein
LAKARQAPFAVEHFCLARDTDQGSGGVEDRDKQEGEHNDDEAEIKSAREVHLEKGRRERRRTRDKAMPRLEAKGDGDQRDAQHADDDGAWDFPQCEASDESRQRRGVPEASTDRRG